MGLPTDPIPNSATKPAPYGMLKVCLIVLTIAVAWTVMIIASATQQDTPDAFAWLRKIGGLLFLAAIGTSYWAKRTWSEIIRVEAEPTLRQKHRWFVLKASVGICVVLLLAAEEGARMGTHIRHVKKIENLAAQLNALAPKSTPTKQRFVHIARQATPTMTDYLQRCDKLEPVLNDYESNLQDGNRVLNQVLAELQQLKGDQGYGVLIPTFTVLQSVTRKDLESAAVFRKEVDYAKQLAAFATPDDQTRFYKANILPIKNDQNRIANEELAILKDAKAHGVDLPELYREAGIQ